MATEAVEKALERPPLKPRPALTLVGSPRVLSSDNYDCFIGVSVNVAALKQFISVQAMAHTPTLIISERGLRQEQVARALHNASENAAQPFFAVNAHSLDSDALHNLLFGTRGMIETCGRGTIYVNELTRLPALLQQRFAAHIEEQRWRANSGRHQGPRLIFATEWNPSDIQAEKQIPDRRDEHPPPSRHASERQQHGAHDLRHLPRRVAQNGKRTAHTA